MPKFKPPVVGEVWKSNLSDLTFTVKSVDEYSPGAWNITVVVQRRVKGVIEEREKNLGQLTFPRFSACYTPPDAGKKSRKA